MDDRAPHVRRDQRRHVQARAGSLRERIRQAYTPGSPITDPTLLAGREELLAKAHRGMQHRGSTLVIYGERGAGKTSFANVLLSERAVVRHTCSVNDTFESIFRTVLAAIGENITVIESSS